MIVEFQTNKGKFGFINLSIFDIFLLDFNKKIDFKVLGFVKDLTEEQWSEVVNKSENKNYDTDDYMWEDYTDITGWRGFKTATESGKSLMESLNLEEGDWLLIKYT